MGKRLSVKRKKRARDKLTAYRKGETPSPHKVAFSRSRKAKLKKAYVMT